MTVNASYQRPVIYMLITNFYALIIIYS